MSQRSRRGRGFARLLACALTATVLAACGERHSPAHDSSTPVVAAEPTPDTTPVEPLRTPAGLALKPEPATTPAASPGAPSPPPPAKATPWAGTSVLPPTPPILPTTGLFLDLSNRPSACAPIAAGLSSSPGASSSVPTAPAAISCPAPIST